MKRYVKEIHSDLCEQLESIALERKQDCSATREKMDNILSMSARGLLTNKEAASALITAFDEEYYSLWAREE